MSYQDVKLTFYKIRSNPTFEVVVMAVIVSSALVIGMKTFPFSTKYVTILTGVDYFISFFFLTELFVRFMAEDSLKNYVKSAWNIFDTIVIVISIIPIDNSELVLIGRVLRIFRVLRMITVVPELRVLLTSLVKVMPKIGYVSAFMFIIFYIYAAIGSTFFQEINSKLWGDISISLLTLFRVMTFEDWTDVMYQTMEVYPLSWTYYLSFIFLTAFAFLNMIIGVVVNELEHASDDDKNKETAERDELLHQVLARLDKIEGRLK
ncbi:ion transporter [Sansalvadorimonas verongulae]|uniref:ion transporter n=1 Tax=Sansalvadorimonas verongulae TaxID=2172824 RepID=UPI002E3714DA|nr:ion transporter [Sansalvadorimonas verongulae]